MAFLLISALAVAAHRLGGGCCNKSFRYGSLRKIWRRSCRTCSVSATAVSTGSAYTRCAQAMGTDNIAEPAQPAGFDEVAARGAHWITVDPPRSNARSAPAPIVSLVPSTTGSSGTRARTGAVLAAPALLHVATTSSGSGRDGAHEVRVTGQAKNAQHVGDRARTGAQIRRKLVLPASAREEAMRALYRMNVTSATLFPDLDGLARSMGYELEVVWERLVRDYRRRIDTEGGAMERP